MTDDRMLIQRVVDDKLSGAKIIEQEARLFEEQIVGISIWRIVELFDANNGRIVVFPGREQGGRIMVLGSPVCLDVIDKFSASSDRVVSAELC